MTSFTDPAVTSPAWLGMRLSVEHRHLPPDHSYARDVMTAFATR